MNVFFRLPDDFVGDEIDALEELVKYRKIARENPKTTVSMDEDLNTDSSKVIYDAWILFQDPEYDKTEYKLFGTGGAFVKKTDGTGWDSIQPKVDRDLSIE